MPIHEERVAATCRKNRLLYTLSGHAAETRSQLGTQKKMKGGQVAARRVWLYFCNLRNANCAKILSLPHVSATKFPQKFVLHELLNVRLRDCLTLFLN